MARFVQKLKDMWTPPEDEYDYEDYDEVEEEEEEEMVYSRRDREEARDREAARRPSGAASNNKVVNIHATTQLQVVLFKPERFGDETCAVADELLKMHTVVLNLENTEKRSPGGFWIFSAALPMPIMGKLSALQRTPLSLPRTM